MINDGFDGALMTLIFLFSKVSSLLTKYFSFLVKFHKCLMTDIKKTDFVLEISRTPNLSKLNYTPCSVCVLHRRQGNKKSSRKESSSSLQ